MDATTPDASTPSSSPQSTAVRSRPCCWERAQKTRLSEPKIPEYKTPAPLSLSSNTYDLDLIHDFTLWDSDKGTFIFGSIDQRNSIFNLLQQTYSNVTAINVMPPWIFIEFEGDVPSDMERPFLVAGLVTVYIPSGDPFPVIPMGASGFGYWGEGEGVDLPAETMEDLRQNHVPREQSLEAVAGVIGNVAEYISTYPTYILVELKKMEIEEFAQKLNVLPSMIGTLLVHYNNGPLIQTVHGHSTDFKLTDETLDQGTDCVLNEGREMTACFLNDNDIVSVESPSTGLQLLRFAGNRYKINIEEEKVSLTLQEAIFQSNYPISPKLRAEMCGAPLRCITKNLNGNGYFSGDMVANFVCYDLVRYYGPMLYCYAHSWGPVGGDLQVECRA